MASSQSACSFRPARFSALGRETPQHDLQFVPTKLRQVQFLVGPFQSPSLCHSERGEESRLCISQHQTLRRFASQGDNEKTLISGTSAFAFIAEMVELVCFMPFIYSIVEMG